MRRFALCTLALALLAGCGSSEPAATADAPAPQRTPVLTSPPPQTVEATPASASRPAADGSPEALIREVTALAAASPGHAANVAPTLTPVSAESLAASDAARQRKIAALALEVVSKTADEPAKAQLFNNAVHYLARAQAALALSGDAKAEADLMSTADDLRRRDGRSFAAAEAAGQIVELARRKAEADGSAEAAAAYAAQARVFAARFPHEANRAAVTLLSAGRWCEDAGHARPAGECYAAVADEFPESLFAAQAAGSARRVGLVGEPLRDFGGPTISGGFIKPEHLANRPVAIVFWSATDETVPEVFAALAEARQKNPRLAVLGVCLEDDAEMAAAAVSHLPKCPHIYSAVPEERGRRSPLARHYGVERTPLVWLVAADGRVASVDAKAEDAGRL